MGTFGAISSRTHYNSKDTQVIVFASYGSASTRFYVVGTPIDLSDMQRVTLNAIPHEDNLPSVGLCFTKDEMDELVSVLYAGEHCFHEQFSRTLLLVTGSEGFSESWCWDLDKRSRFYYSWLLLHIHGGYQIL